MKMCIQKHRLVWLMSK